MFSSSVKRTNKINLELKILQLLTQWTISQGKMEEIVHFCNTLVQLELKVAVLLQAAEEQVYIARHNYLMMKNILRADSFNMKKKIGILRGDLIDLIVVSELNKKFKYTVPKMNTDENTIIPVQKLTILMIIQHLLEKVH